MSKPLIILLIASAVLVPQEIAFGAESFYDAATREGHQARSAGDFDRAVTMFETAVKECEQLGLTDRQKIVALNNLADSYLDQNKGDKARETCSNALAQLARAGIAIDDPLFQRTHQIYNRAVGRNVLDDKSVEASSSSSAPNNVSADSKTSAPKHSDEENEKKQEFNNPPNSEKSSAKTNKPLLKKLLKKASFWNLEFYFVAQNAENCELFYGMVHHNPLIGKSTSQFRFPSGCECRASTRITYTPMSGGARGSRGKVTASCNDGRTIEGDFTLASMTTGHGTASDTKGNRYEFTFGHTAKEAIQRVNALRKQLGCDEITIKGVNLEVQGQILKMD